MGQSDHLRKHFLDPRLVRQHRRQPRPLSDTPTGPLSDSSRPEDTHTHTLAEGESASEGTGGNGRAGGNLAAPIAPRKGRAMRPACEPTAALGGFVCTELLFASACTSPSLASRSRCASSPRPTFCPLFGKNCIILQTLKHNFGPRHYLVAKVKVASSE